MHLCFCQAASNYIERFSRLWAEYVNISGYNTMTPHATVGLSEKIVLSQRMINTQIEELFVHRKL